MYYRCESFVSAICYACAYVRKLVQAFAVIVPSKEDFCGLFLYSHEE